MDEYVKLAQNAVKTFLKNREILEVPAKLPKKMLTERAGVFVSIHTRPSELRGLPRRHALATRGRSPREQVSDLRGCIGTFLPTQENIAQEIIKNALSAAFNDPRFPPVNEEELKDLVFKVDILSQPKKLNAKRYTLNPKRYGLIISTQDGRRSLLLPDIPGVNTPEQQLAICYRKAGISPREEIKIQTFTVERHEEK